MLQLLVVAMLAQGAPDAGPLIVPPTAKCEGAPEYPPSERGSGIETDVVVQITLAADGGVTKREAFQLAVKSMSATKKTPHTTDIENKHTHTSAHSFF